MLFNSIAFAVFLPVVFALYWLVGPRRRGVQNLLLIVASYVFYGWWDWRFLLLIVVSSAVDYGIGIGLGRSDDERRRKMLLTASLLVNLGFLGFFKYFNFFVDSFRGSAGVGGDASEHAGPAHRAAGGHQLLHVPDPELLHRRV